MIIIWDFLLFHEILFLPQMKRCTNITYNHGIRKFASWVAKRLFRRWTGLYVHTRKKSLRIFKIRKYQQSFKISKSNCLLPSPLLLKWNFVNTSKKILKNRKNISVVRYSAWKLKLVSNIFWLVFSGNNFLLVTRPRPHQS